MKRLSILLLCFLPTLGHANPVLWETFARAWGPVMIEFFKDYYAEKATEDDDAVIAEDEAIQIGPMCFIDEYVAEEELD